MDIDTRPARIDDVEAAVPLIYSSGPAAFDYVFAHETKGSARDFLRFAFVDGRGEFGFRNHTVVVANGGVVGVGACFSGAHRLTFTATAFRQILSFYGLASSWGILRRGLQVERIVRPPAGTLVLIVHLGVRPELRGNGIGARLVERLLAQAKETGGVIAGLDVSVENPRAQILYERLGFRVVHERHSRLRNAFAAVPSHRRMEKRL